MSAGKINSITVTMLWNNTMGAALGSPLLYAQGKMNLSCSIQRKALCISYFDKGEYHVITTDFWEFRKR